jgi:REP element-mobilizing transposase RayT
MPAQAPIPHAEAKSAVAANSHYQAPQAPDLFTEPAHFLTISTLFHRPLFLEQDAARAVSRVQIEPAIWGNSQCLAWVLMPDRWHGLVVVGEGDSLERLVHRFKSVCARAIEPRFRVNGWLWAKGFNERALPSDESVLAVARHLVANPVRAGLARSVGEYPYWNAIWLDSDANVKSGRA